MEPLTFIVVLMFGFGGGWTLKTGQMQAKAKEASQQKIEQSK